MRTRTIYRVENTQGIGMFRSANWKQVERNTRIMSRHGKFNTPVQDGLSVRKERKHWFCAYKTKRELKKWVKPSEFKFLIQSLGFEVVKIKVNVYQEGSHQILFLKKEIISKEIITNQFV